MFLKAARLLNSYNLLRAASIILFCWHTHGTSLPNSGCSSGRSRCKKPTPPQIGQTSEGAEGSSGDDEVGILPFAIPFALFFSGFSIGSIAPFLFP